MGIFKSKFALTAGRCLKVNRIKFCKLSPFYLMSYTHKKTFRYEFLQILLGRFSIYITLSIYKNIGKIKIK